MDVREEPAGNGPSRAGRFAAAIALAVGFSTLALVIAGALLAVAGLLVGGSILFAIFPRRARFEPPGVRIDERDQPRLVGLVAEEARAAGEDPPDEVYATLEANASVLELGRRGRLMLLGLPLLHLLTERGLRGVVAHELGRYANGDTQLGPHTRLGPWIYRTREAIERSIVRLNPEDIGWTQRAARRVFIGYGNAFLRITNALARRQEFAADAFAARRAGREAHCDALRRIHAYAPAFESYWAVEVVPVLESGRRPDVVGGFAQFVSTERVRQAADSQLEHELDEAATSPYDSHPSLAERLAAVAQMPAGEPDDSGDALGLVADPAALETRILEHLLGPEDFDDFTPVAWGDVGMVVYVERARAMAEHFAPVLAGSTVGGLGDAVADLDRLAGEVRRIDDVGVDDAEAVAGMLLVAGLTAALADAGWRVEAPPGEPVTCRRGDERVGPSEVLEALETGDLAAPDWRARTEALGIASLPLGSAGAAAEPASPAAR